MPYAEINGQKLYYEDTGGSGPAVVFSHGLLMDQSMFNPQVTELKDCYRCVTWDARGHGRTAGDSTAAFTYDDSADDIAALLAHLSVQHAVLAGMSQGGFASLRCALRHPDIVRGLILLDTQAGLEDPAMLPAYQQMVEIWTSQGLSDEIANTLEPIILGLNWSGSATWKDKWRDWTPANLQQCFNTLVERDDLSPKLGQINMPALVVHGDSDFAISLERGQAMAEALPKAELVVIKGAGHAANLTHADEVNVPIEKFLAQLD